MSRRKKRHSWSDDEKREICQQTVPLGVSVAQVARRYAMNANMIYTWLKDPRFAPPGVAPEDAVEDVPLKQNPQRGGNALFYGFYSLKSRCRCRICRLPLMSPGHLPLIGSIGDTR